MVLIPDRKLFLLFTACLAISVISAPIPTAKYGSLENPANPAPLLRGPDGKPVDMSKWPWKRDLERRGLRLSRRDSAQKPLSLEPSKALSKPATDADATKSSPSEAPGKPVKKPDADGRKDKSASPASSVTKPPQSAQKPLSPDLQPPTPDPIIKPLHPHHVRLRPRGLDLEEEAALSRRYSQSQTPLVRRAPEGPTSNSDLKVIGHVEYIPWYTKRSQLGVTADALERRFWALDTLMTLEKRRAAVDNDLERRWMLLDEWEELDRRVTDFQKLIDESIKRLGGYGKKPRKSHRPHDADSATTPGALCKLPGAHCGPATPPVPAAQSPGEPAPVPIERRDMDDLDLRSLLDLDLDELERRIDNIQQIFNEAIKASGGTHKAQRKSHRPRDADSATTQGALCKIPGAHCGPAAPAAKSSEPAPVPIERRDIDDLNIRSLLNLDLEELERRMDNIQQIFNEAIKASGGTHKAQRKSHRPRDADSATTQGALCKLAGAHCEPPAAATSNPSPVPIARSYIPDDDLTTRDMGLDEYVEDIARRLLQVRSALANDGSLPVLHSANPSFMFESALRDAVHPHGLAPTNLEGSTASFKDQLAAAARERAAKESGNPKS